MALLHAVAFLHRRGEVRARAVTVDHGLQTVTAEVADRVAATSESWGVPADVATVSIEAGEEGLEAAARTARYAALETVRVEAGADWILTAHTRSDQAETVLLGLMRGSGTRSLAGMSPVSGHLMRPLLGLDRDQTEASCTAQGIEIWNDPMNVDTAYSGVRARQPLPDSKPNSASRSPRISPVPPTCAGRTPISSMTAPRRPDSGSGEPPRCRWRISLLLTMPCSAESCATG